MASTSHHGLHRGTQSVLLATPYRNTDKTEEQQSSALQPRLLLHPSHFWDTEGFARCTASPSPCWWICDNWGGDRPSRPPVPLFLEKNRASKPDPETGLSAIAWVLWEAQPIPFLCQPWLLVPPSPRGPSSGSRAPTPPQGFTSTAPALPGNLLTMPFCQVLDLQHQESWEVDLPGTHRQETLQETPVMLRWEQLPSGYASQATLLPFPLWEPWSLWRTGLSQSTNWDWQELLLWAGTKTHAHFPRVNKLYSWVEET